MEPFPTLALIPLFPEFFSDCFSSIDEGLTELKGSVPARPSLGKDSDVDECAYELLDVTLFFRTLRYPCYRFCQRGILNHLKAILFQ